MGIPIRPAFDDFQEDLRMTCAAYGTDSRSISSLSALTSTVFQKRSMARSVWPWRFSHVRKDFARIFRGHRCQSCHGRCDGKLVLQPQASSFQECRRGVQWRRPRRWTNNRSPSTRFKKCHLIEPADFFLDAKTLIKLNQVGAAAQQTC